MASLRDMRRCRALNRAELAKRIGVTYQAVAQWESGRRVPDYATCEKLSAELGVPWATIHETLWRKKQFRSGWEPKIKDLRDRMLAVADDAMKSGDETLRKEAMRVAEEFEAALQVEVEE